MKQSVINIGHDETDVHAGCVDVSVVVGTWFNTNRTSPEIAKVELDHLDDGLVIRVHGVEQDTVVDWGQAYAVPHAAQNHTGEVTGFEAHFQTDKLDRHLAANLKFGVLVIQCYKRLRGHARGGGHFTREFFHQRLPSLDQPSLDQQSRVASGNGSDVPYMKAGDWFEQRGDVDSQRATVELAPLLGIWRNTYHHTREISHLQLRRDGDQYLVHAFGVAAPRDWGAVSAVAYAENVSSHRPSGFFAQYDFGFMDVQLAANENKGLLIVAAYNRFKDRSGRANYFTREFFYHEQPSA